MTDKTKQSDILLRLYSLREKMDKKSEILAEIEKQQYDLGSRARVLKSERQELQGELNGVWDEMRTLMLDALVSNNPNIITLRDELILAMKLIKDQEKANG